MGKNQEAAMVLDSILEDAYCRGYAEAVEKGGRHRRAIRERKARKRYFLTQKLYGLAVLIITVIAVWVLDGDATIAVITVPLGVVLITSREMLIANKYYWQHESEQKGRGEDAFYHQ